MPMNEGQRKLRRDEPLRISLLRTLRTLGPQTSMEMTLRLDAYPGKDVTQARNGVNGRLGDMCRAGHAEVIGTVPSHYNNTPAFLWSITPAGRQHLAAWTKRRAKRQIEATTRRKREERKETLLRTLIRQALSNGWGPGTPTAERRAISRELRAEGMPYNWIAAIFDVSHEIVRQDCHGLARRKGQNVRVAPVVLPPADAPGFVWERTRTGVA